MSPDDSEEGFTPPVFPARGAVGRNRLGAQEHWLRLI